MHRKINQARHPASAFLKQAGPFQAAASSGICLRFSRLSPAVLIGLLKMYHKMEILQLFM
ncbi:hypothetical protein LI092_10400, partial [Streptococcus parasanguinis]|uniref:hypothetical protein n=1 Tax=Streptococcus parasanguinis TaxID=1318 RepID=UPI001D076646